MFRAQPVANALCDEKWRERSYRIHRQKLQKIKPSIDNKTPTLYPHLYQKLKKAQMEEERCTEIERDNRTLVRRMTAIMQRSSLDSRNPVQYKSLNKDRRRRELIKITQENQALLRRIQTKQPTYNHLVWEQEREKNEALCERICRYPYRTDEGEQEDVEEGLYEHYAAQSEARSSSPAASKPGKGAPSSPGAASSHHSADGKWDLAASKQSMLSQSQNTASPTKSDKDDDELSQSKMSQKQDLAASKATTDHQSDEEDDENAEDKDDEEEEKEEDDE